MTGIYRCVYALHRPPKKSCGIMLLRLAPSLFTSTTSTCIPRLKKIENSKSQDFPVLTRSFSARGPESSTPTTAEDTQEKVDIGPGTWKEVYHGLLTTQIRLVKTFSLTTSAMGLMMQPILVQKSVDTSMGLLLATGTFIGFFTFVTPFLIHWITKKYVTRLEYDLHQDIYTATTLSFLLREKKTRFRLDDVEIPDVPGMFTTFHAKNLPFFVDPSMFTELEHYGRIMGYDKPLDLRFKDEDKK